MANGLNTKEEKSLTRCLAQIDIILSRRCLMGHGEAEEMTLLAKQISTRLNPPTPDHLCERTAYLLDRLKGLPWADTLLADKAAA
jgi:hypothetical protein